MKSKPPLFAPSKIAVADGRSRLKREAFRRGGDVSCGNAGEVWFNKYDCPTFVRVSPAMAAGLTDKLLDWTDLVKMIDAYEPEKTSN